MGHNDVGFTGTNEGGAADAAPPSQQQPEPPQQPEQQPESVSPAAPVISIGAMPPPIDGYRYIDPCIDICQYVSVDQCCAPILETPVRPDEADTLATRFRALGDPARLRLLSLIASCGEVCACELVESIGVSQPTVSHHLKVLYEAGLVDRERRGKWIHYWVVPGAISALADTLQVPEPESVPIALRTG